MNRLVKDLLLISAGAAVGVFVTKVIEPVTSCSCGRAGALEKVITEHLEDLTETHRTFVEKFEEDNDLEHAVAANIVANTFNHFVHKNRITLQENGVDCNLFNIELENGYNPDAEV